MQQHGHACLAPASKRTSSCSTPATLRRPGDDDTDTAASLPSIPLAREFDSRSRTHANSGTVNFNFQRESIRHFPCSPTSSRHAQLVLKISVKVKAFVDPFAIPNLFCVSNFSTK